MRRDLSKKKPRKSGLRQTVLLGCAATLLTVVPISQALAEAPDSGGSLTVLDRNEWERCASENQLCRFSGTGLVAYGAGDRYFTKTLRSPVQCTNAVFGDPVENTRKACYVLRSRASSPFTQPIARSGNFAIRVETPDCDNFFDTISKYGGRALNAATFLNPYRQIYEFAKAGGDPERYVENMKREFEEVKTFAGDAAAFALAENPVGVLATMHYVSKLLPDGQVKNFMGRGRRTVANLGRSVVVSSLETVEDDFLEIAGDAWNIVKNIDDPEQFFSEFGKGYQKWSPTGALTLIFTSDDPALGARLAAARLGRQAEIASTYLLKTPVKKQLMQKARTLQQLHKAGRLRNARAIDVAKSLGGLDLTRASAKQVMTTIIKGEIRKRATEAGKSLVSSAQPSDREAMAYLVGQMALAADSNDKPLGYHRLYHDTQVTNVPAKWMGDDHNTGATHDMSGYHPVVENGSDCISLGDNITQRGGHKTLKALCGKPGTRAVAKGKDKWWARPVDFIPIYNDSCSGGTHNRSIWIPKCPQGFRPVGVALAGEGSQKPLPNRIACLRDDPTIMQPTDGLTAGLVWETNDSGSGAKYDVTIYNRDFHGMQLSWAVTGYPNRNDQTYLRKLEIPIARTHRTIVEREESIAAALARAKREAESNIRAGGGQDAVASQWNVGDQVEVLRPADGRWTAASVLALDARNGVFIQYQDTSQQMWVNEGSVRASQGGGGQNAVASRWNAGDQVEVFRPADGMWTAASVLDVDPIDGVFIEYHDTYVQMWVDEGSVRESQGGGGQWDGGGEWDGGSQWDGQEPQAAGGCELRGQIASSSNNQPATLHIVNSGSTYIYVYWIDFGGAEGDYQSAPQPLMSISPGDVQSVASYVGFAFTVVDENSNCLGVVETFEGVNEFAFAGFGQ